jgi:quercetin dioxygenase-like cupin family protein
MAGGKWDGQVKGREIVSDGKKEFAMTIKQSRDIPFHNVKTGENVEMQVLIPATEAPNFAMRRFVIHPNGGMPKHTNTVEHEQFVLVGSASVGVGEDVYKVHKGDVLLIPEGVPHWYRNNGDVDFEFLCMIPNKQDEITIINKEC